MPSWLATVSITSWRPPSPWKALAWWKEKKGLVSNTHLCRPVGRGCGGGGYLLAGPRWPACARRQPRAPAPKLGLALGQGQLLAAWICQSGSSAMHAGASQRRATAHREAQCPEAQAGSWHGQRAQTGRGRAWRTYPWSRGGRGAGQRECALSWIHRTRGTQRCSSSQKCTRWPSTDESLVCRREGVQGQGICWLRLAFIRSGHGSVRRAGGAAGR